MTNRQKIQHLYARAGFGCHPQDLATDHSPAQALQLLFRDSATPEPLAIVFPPPLTAENGAAVSRQQLTPEQRRQQRRQHNELTRELNTTWLYHMARTPGQLREKMTLFWHGHFACQALDPRLALQLNNSLRQHALGNFGDLLRAVAQAPAMLAYLNNNSNRKDRPNENLARELLELFTLGRGHYTEQDVKEAARALTGWTFNQEREFIFNEKRHDDGSKTFLGQTGWFTGDDILRILLEQPRCAEFITTKLYRYFVNDTPAPQHIRPLATKFHQSGYDLTVLMEAMLSAPWFYDAANVGNRLKSPVELLAGILRTFELRLTDSSLLIALQKSLGQQLFRPPNVAGWPGGLSWIDSSTMLIRLNLPRALFEAVQLQVSLKDDENDLKPQTTGAQPELQRSGVQLNWQPIRQWLKGTPGGGELTRLSELLLSQPLHGRIRQVVEQAVAQDTSPDRLRALAVALLSVPEYQLC